MKDVKQMLKTEIVKAYKKGSSDMGNLLIDAVKMTAQHKTTWTTEEVLNMLTVAVESGVLKGGE